MASRSVAYLILGMGILALWILLLLATVAAAADWDLTGIAGWSTGRVDKLEVVFGSPSHGGNLPPMGAGDTERHIFYDSPMEGSLFEAVSLRWWVNEYVGVGLTGWQTRLVMADSVGKDVYCASFLSQCVTTSPTPIGPTSINVWAGALDLMVRYPNKYLEPYGGFGIGAERIWLTGHARESIDPVLHAVLGVRLPLTEHLGVNLEAHGSRAQHKARGVDQSVELTVEMLGVGLGLSWRF